MIRLAFIGSLLCAGCFSETPDNGALLCSTDGKCPKGYDCQMGACFKTGSAPAALVADRCDGTVPVHASSATEFSVDTNGLGDDFSQLASCTGSAEPGNDAFFAVDVKKGGRWHFHIKPVSPTTADPAVYVVPSCDDRACMPAMAEDECGGGSAEHLSIIPTSDGRLIVGIDSKVAGGAKFSVLALHPVCGNGMAEHSESCDDGNTMGFDGCDESCRWELSPTQPAEKEPNDDTVGANVLIPASLPITGTIGGKCDYDTFLLHVPANGSVSAKLAGTGKSLCDGTAPGFELALIGLDGQTPLGKVTSAAGAACPEIDAMTQAWSAKLPAGVYWVRLTTVPNDFATPFTYQLTITIGS